jgi:hypothetical protein
MALGRRFVGQFPVRSAGVRREGERQNWPGGDDYPLDIYRFLHYGNGVKEGHNENPAWNPAVQRTAIFFERS